VKKENEGRALALFDILLWLFPALFVHKSGREYGEFAGV